MDKVKVAVRVRPMNKREVSLENDLLVAIKILYIY